MTQDYQYVPGPAENKKFWSVADIASLRQLRMHYTTYQVMK